MFVLRQIFSGRRKASPRPQFVQATINAKDTIDYGTKVVGGVSPDKGGRTHLGLPVFGTVKEAMKEVKPDVSAVFVPAKFAAAAILEAIEAEVPLVVSVAEHVPVHDMLRVHEVLRTQSKTRLGQSLVVGMGGDMLPGTTLADGLKLFFNHDETKGIIVIGEIGGEAELEAAELIREHRRTSPRPKPVIAMVAGRTAPEGKAMGHAGAIWRDGDVTAEVKTKALEDAGAIIVPHPGVMGERMKELLH
ncbi:succinyl ligase subunit alpha-2 mitochondrial [Fusarium coicis]|nr:succinyl ligase subunit alpha-2 mitochondrial [Fusarium coicis]